MKQLKQRKMVWMLPVLIIPFLTMAFWALGGGKGNSETVALETGLNTGLPDARFEDDHLIDKLGFYDKAARDSQKIEEWMRNDPYFKKDSAFDPIGTDELLDMTETMAGKYKQSLNTSLYDRAGANPEDQVLTKLKLLEKELNRPVTRDPVGNENDPETSWELPNGGTTEDPEMKQIEGALEKILDIQHPQRVKERSMKDKGKAFAVNREFRKDTIVTGFFGQGGEDATDVTREIGAVVHQNQAIVNGAVVKFRLTDDIYINGSLIPKQCFVSGIAVLHDERLEVEIHSIRSGSSLYPVKLEVYDTDGLPGIYIPGAMGREVLKESTENNVSLMDLESIDPSLKGKAIQAGIGTLKSLLARKAKMVKVMIKSGYKVFLKNKN